MHSAFFKSLDRSVNT